MDIADWLGWLAFAAAALWLFLRAGPNADQALTDSLSPLIYALEKFKNDNGPYPQVLGQLVPTYIGAIPKKGLWIRYRVYGRGAGFTLICDSLLGSATYESQRGWSLTPF